MRKYNVAFVGDLFTIGIDLATSSCETFGTPHTLLPETEIDYQKTCKLYENFLCLPALVFVFSLVFSSFSPSGNSEDVRISYIIWLTLIIFCC